MNNKIKPKIGFLCFFITCFLAGFGQAIPVEIIKESNGSFKLLRSGEPYWIKGAGTGNIERLSELAARGGNSVRTWGVNENTPAFLDSAHSLGLSVMLGLWIQRETDGFDYNNQTKVAEQLEKFTQIVKQYKDHPALLAWGIGNEANMNYSNLKVWNAVNDISIMIHDIDGVHPTLTVTAGISVDLANTIYSMAPDLDMLGINMYGGISNVAGNIQKSNWDKPYVITEWGINGPWESAHASWGAPIEMNSSEKASLIQQRYEDYILPNKDKCTGSYVFLWNSKIEGTLTWFGLFVNTETTEMIDAMQKLWTGNWPSNRAPSMISTNIEGYLEKKSYVITSSINTIEVNAQDTDNDKLYYEFIIRPETGSEGLEIIPGATFEGIPGIISQSGTNQAKLSFKEADNNKNYRLYIFARDSNWHVGTLNLPLHTELEDIYQEFKFKPKGDAYIGDGAYSNFFFGRDSSQELRVKNSLTAGETRITYMVFDFENAPRSFSSANLALFGKGMQEGEIEVWGFGGYYWDENKLNWSNSIIPGSGMLAKTWVQSGDPQWYSWDLRDFLEKQFEQKNRMITFVLLAPNENAENPVVFNSKEAPNNLPELKITTGTTSSLPPVEKTHNDVSIYPNPAYDFLNITLPGSWQEKTYVKIYNMNGIEIRNYSFNPEPDNRIIYVSLQGLSNNMYIARIISADYRKDVSCCFLKTGIQDKGYK